MSLMKRRSRKYSEISSRTQSNSRNVAKSALAARTSLTAIRSPSLCPTRVSVLRLKIRIACFSSTFRSTALARGRVKGTGLGLALSKQLAELLGGVNSTEKRVRSRVRNLRSGCHVGLSGRAETEPKTETRSRSRKATRSHLPCVLVIDDEDVGRYLVTKLLSALPAEVREARGGSEGMQYAREYPVDLIVLDLAMPDANGFQLIAQLETEPATHDIPVVVHTSLSLGESERKALSHAQSDCKQVPHGTGITGSGQIVGRACSLKATVEVLWRIQES